MILRRGAAFALAAVLVAAVAASGSGPRLTVPAGVPLRPVLARLGPGWTVELESGTHRGPFEVPAGIAVVGRPGARVAAPPTAAAAVSVAGSGASVREIDVVGGSTGILVRDADDVVVDGVSISGADLHGIEVVDASAHVTGSSVRRLADPLAQGIEIRNSEGRSTTVVESSTVAGGMEGIVSHVSSVDIIDNRVTATSLRAIAITEMSTGTAANNEIAHAAGAGLYCGDMSRCRFESNTVATVAAAGGAAAAAGWGLVSYYHSTASDDGNVLSGARGAATALVGARISDRSPLRPGPGAGALPSAAIAVAAAGALVAAAYPIARRAGGGARPRVRPHIWAAALAAAVGVQSFHMVEHVVQVVRVHAHGVPSRGGLAGPAVDAEWIHFAYNAAVLSALAALVLLRPDGLRRAGAERLLMAGVLVQGYHVVEHTAKVVQHVATGAQVNPGLLGGHFDLVWFHFSINLAVYGAVVGAAALWLGARLQRPAQRVETAAA